MWNDSCLRPPPPPQERDKSINNLLIYFTSLSSNLIAGSFVSVELWGRWRWCRGEDKYREGGGMLQSRRRKETASFLFVFMLGFFCPCMAAFCWRRSETQLLSTASVVCLLLQHCLHWFITLEEANTRMGGEKDREEQSFHKLSERKNLISNINARRSTLCAIVLLSFQKLVF